MVDTTSPVVVQGGKLTCSHGGVAMVASASARLKVTVGTVAMGVVLSGQESGVSFANGTPPCLNTTTSSPPAAAPCTSGSATAGTSTKLKVGSLAVLLTSAGGTTTPGATPANPPFTWSVAAPGQGKLKAG